MVEPGGRVFRQYIGPTDSKRKTPLHVLRFLVLDTIEEKIAEILNRKEALFDKVVESVDTPGHRFTREELMRILEITPEGFSSG